MTQTQKQKLGKWGEQTACDYLSRQGYQILDINHRTPYGEIDLVTSHEDMIIFVEVKTRASSTLGMPEISITTKKQSHMIQSAEYYIQQHPHIAGTWRIDVITVQRQSPSQPPTITHFKNAIS